MLAWTILGFFLTTVQAQCYRWGERTGYRHGYEASYRAEDRKAEKIIEGYRRVQKIREEAEYRRGLEACR